MKGHFCDIIEWTFATSPKRILRLQDQANMARELPLVGSCTRKRRTNDVGARTERTNLPWPAGAFTITLGYRLSTTWILLGCGLLSSEAPRGVLQETSTPRGHAGSAGDIAVIRPLWGAASPGVGAEHYVWYEAGLANAWQFLCLENLDVPQRCLPRMGPKSGIEGSGGGTARRECCTVTRCLGL